MASINSKEEAETPIADNHDASSESNTHPHSSNSLSRIESKHYTETHTLSLVHELLIVGIIGMSQWTTQMGLGQCISILHVIGAHFNLENSPATLNWLIAGYSLTVGTFILFSGRLGDYFGLKRMLLIGYAWYAVWSVVAGLAWYSNHVLFVFARIFQGIGPAITLPNGLALLGAIYPPGERKNMAFAFFGACAPAGSIVGSVFGGIWALTWWPWTFLSFGIALGLIGVAAHFIIPDPQTSKPCQRKVAFAQLMQELDVLGAVVGITALVLFNFAWNQSGLVSWDNAYVIVTLILGVLLFPVFIYIELKIASHPLVPWDVFTSDNAFVLACLSLGWASFGVWYYYIWQIIEVLRSASPLLATAYLSPVTVAGFIAAGATGLLMHRVKPAWLMVTAMTAYTIANILLATQPVFQIYWAQIFVGVIIAPFGMDMSFPSATMVISNSVRKEHQGVGASLVNTIVNYSISIGLGFAGTAEVNRNNGGGSFEDVLRGYRAATYVGIGLSGLGLVVGIAFVVRSYYEDYRDGRRKRNAESVEGKA